MKKNILILLVLAWSLCAQTQKMDKTNIAKKISRLLKLEMFKQEKTSA